ncbi:MAG TPA: SCO family protein [Bryobacteraceae bacterium]|nr:SCO family protein [Bryobacteraceae bacterium]
MSAFAVPLLLAQMVFAPVAGSAAPEAPSSLDMSGMGRPDVLKGVTIEQRLNAQIPLDTSFRDEYGQAVSLSSYFGKRPVILALVYYECPMLCTQILNGVVRTAKQLTFTPGKDYDVVVISFDPRETPTQALAKKQTYMRAFGRPETAGGWHFLTGKPDSIGRVTDAVGFRYKWDPALATFAHASAIYVLTPEGKLSKYFYGINYSPTDLRFGLVEASHDRIGTAVDQILLFCCQFDPHTGKYTSLALGMLRVAGAGTLLLMGGFVVIMRRRGRQGKASAA